MRKAVSKKSGSGKWAFKGRRILASLLAVLTAFGVSSAFAACEDVEDYIPKTYGEWDGNYLYGGNARVKTTGEDCEALVTEVQTEYGTLTVDECIDHEIDGEKIYLALRLDNGEDGGSMAVRANALVVYDVKEKTQALIKYFHNGYKEDKTWDGETEYSVRISDIVAVRNGDEVVLDVDIHKRRDDGQFPMNYEYIWIGVAPNGSIDHEKYAGLEVYRNGESFRKGWFGGEHFICTSYDGENGLFYRTWDSEPVCLVECEGEQWVEFEYCAKPQGIFVKRYGYAGGSDDGGYDGGDTEDFFGAYFYDLKERELHTLCEGTKERFKAVGDGYYMTYNTLEKTYKVREGCSSKTLTEKTSGNCVLYRLADGADGLTVEKVAALKKDYNFVRAHEKTAGKIYFSAGKYRSMSGLFYKGGYEVVNFSFDLTTGKLKEISSDAYNGADEKREKERAKATPYVCGEYTYYLTVNMLKHVNGHSMAITLTGEKDGKSVAMQFGQPHLHEQHEKARFSVEFWQGVTNRGRVEPYGRILICGY